MLGNLLKMLLKGRKTVMFDYAKYSHHDHHGSNADQSIICDSCLEWYHFSCAGVITPPKMTYWFCRNCFAAAKNVD